MSFPLSYITRENLSAILLEENPSHNGLAIIDVRDDDHVGGHIRSSTNVPSSSLDFRLPELVRKLSETELVIFHCALSQQRGPTAARRYLGERERLMKKYPEMRDDEDGRRPDSESDSNNQEKLKAKPKQSRVSQKVFVLDGGFVKWQEKYGRDPRLTESFAPDIWIDYY